MITSQIAIEPMKAAVVSLKSPPEALTTQLIIKLGAMVHMMAIQKKILWNKGENSLFVAMIPTPKKRRRAVKAIRNRTRQRKMFLGTATYIPVFLSS